MAVDVAVHPLPCTQAEYEYFKTIYDGFCYLIDHKKGQSNSKYTYTQREVLEYLKGFWPVIEAICQGLNIELELTLDDVRHAIRGFDMKDAAEFCVRGRYSSMPATRVIEIEQERLQHLTKELFDTLLVRLHKTFRKSPKIVIEPTAELCRTDWQNITIVPAPKALEQKSTTKAKTAPRPSVETLIKTDSDILQAMAASRKANMLQVEIEIDAGYSKHVVRQRLVHLEKMHYVIKPSGTCRKGWSLTAIGRETALKK